MRDRNSCNTIKKPGSIAQPIELSQLEAILHSLSDAVIVTNEYNEVALLNKEAARLFVLQPEKVLRKDVSEVVHDQWLIELIKKAQQDAQFAKPTQYERELKLPTIGSNYNNDYKQVYSVTLICITKGNDEVANVVTIIHDMTSQQEMSQMKFELVSKASHELRTPLSSIGAYIEMLVDGEVTDSDVRHDCYQVIQSEVQRLKRLIDNMLNIDRIEAGICMSDQDQVNIADLIDKAVQILMPHAQARNVSLSKKVASEDLVVQGDLEMLYQVVLNLTSNAIEHTPDGGRVIVKAHADNLTSSVKMSVEDSGCGISAEDLPKLFDKFYRVEQNNQTAKGSGLGLSLCKHVVETLHDGQIGVESKLGKGSKFCISIPVRSLKLNTAAKGERNADSNPCC